MSEISLKSPHFKQREVDNYRLVAEINVGSCIAACGSEDIDIPGLTIANTGAATFTLSGFEAESDVSLDSSRRAGFIIHSPGTSAGFSTAEVGALNATSAIVSGTAGSRIVTVTLAAGAGGVALSTTDSLENAVVEFILPIKPKDF
jgi:hypothetical protein